LKYLLFMIDNKEDVSWYNKGNRWNPQLFTHKLSKLNDRTQFSSENMI